MINCIDMNKIFNTFQKGSGQGPHVLQMSHTTIPIIPQAGIKQKPPN